MVIAIGLMTDSVTYNVKATYIRVGRTLKQPYGIFKASVSAGHLVLESCYVLELFSF